MKFKVIITPFLCIILIIDIISLIPSPFIFVASMMSAAGGNEINFKDPYEIIIRLLWLLSAYYPVYIILSYIIGRNLLIKKNKKAGYFLCILSVFMALFVALFVIFLIVWLFVKSNIST